MGNSKVTIKAVSLLRFADLFGNLMKLCAALHKTGKDENDLDRVPG